MVIYSNVNDRPDDQAPETGATHWTYEILIILMLVSAGVIAGWKLQAKYPEHLNYSSLLKCGVTGALLTIAGIGMIYQAEPDTTLAFKNLHLTAKFLSFFYGLFLGAFASATHPEDNDESNTLQP